MHVFILEPILKHRNRCISVQFAHQSLLYMSGSMLFRHSANGDNVPRAHIRTRVRTFRMKQRGPGRIRVHRCQGVTMSD